jgi:dUTP pyrophosphatase
MIIKVKKTNSTIPTPKYAIEGDAGLDLTAVEVLKSDYKSVIYNTGLAFEIRDGYIGFIYPRSSVRKYDLIMANSVGVVDSNYRGTVQVSFKRTVIGSIKYILNCILLFIGFGFNLKEYELGDRICQLIILPYPQIKLKVVEELTETKRGESGHGSTGNK